ncbi:MAG: type I restriction endonuclease subunit R [Anaerolineae bacterium]|nr:type I restriction endonuclease subunit R [Anaerolineae bacterium]
MTGRPHSEYYDVELPLIEQLKSMGWQHIEGDRDVAYLTERDAFKQPLLLGRLRAALGRINPWLDAARIAQAVIALERLPAASLLDANLAATELLLKGVVLAGRPDLHGGRDQTAHYIDWENLDNNDFLVINQFRVDPPWATGSKDHILPDAALFVNGIPLVVIECKARDAAEPMLEGINQLRRYANQRGSATPEGVERLFYYNQFTVSTHFDRARFGTISSTAKHYLPWKDTSPVPVAAVAAALGKEHLSEQEMLVAGMLRPAHLLDLVRNFILFKDSDGRTIKIVGRYQQFRAVHAAVARLQTGATRLQDGEFDRRGGVIWHTQGAGKSLTMVFLVRKMRRSPALQRFKVVVVTDRKDLQDQLRATAALTGETVTTARNTKNLKRLLRMPGPGLVFATIQKYQERDLERRRGSAEIFPELNASEDILILVDEAHRSHTNDLHANLVRALPNSARIGFTGTPILLEDRKKTAEIFGPFIDKYKIMESVADGVTVPILYEGRMAEAIVEGAETLDGLFEQFFTGYTPEAKEKLKAKYATPAAVLEAEELVTAKARDMLRHYVRVALPGGFKAQVVAVSRRAAVRYQAALERARDELVAEAAAIDPALLALDAEALAARGEDAQTRVAARRRLDDVRRLEFAAVISAERNKDPKAWRRWTDRANVDRHIADFKKSFAHEDPAQCSPLAFLCVKSMLLTGFDAPVEQVMYLDRGMRQHDLLQAIARVNRTADGKEHGLVVDYYGITRRLEEALSVYSAEDVQGALTGLRDALPALRDRHARALAVFEARGLSLDDEEACVAALRDPKLRAEFAARLKLFLASIDTVLPRPEALPYLPDARRLGWINRAAANRYRDLQLDLDGMGEKVRALIDASIRARGVDPKTPPVSILDPNFIRVVEGHPSARARALEMQYAVQYHISTHLEDDPVYYRKLSERLRAILERFKDNWDALEEELPALVAEIRQGPPQREEYGLDAVQTPFFHVLLDAAGAGGAGRREALAARTVELVEHLRQEIKVVDFWRNLQAQNVLRGWIVRSFLDEYDLAPFDAQGAVADLLVDLARRHHEALVR